MGLVLSVFGVFSSAQAQYVKAIQIGTILNPAGWEGLYDAGEVVSKMLNMRGRNFKKLILVPPSKKKRSEDQMIDDPDAPPKKEKKLPVHFQVEGELLEFNPQVPIPDTLAYIALPGETLAEVQIHVRVIHYQTQRVIAEKIIWGVGGEGTEPFANTPESLIPGHPDFQKTSMGRALEKLSDSTFEFLSEVMVQAPLDAQVLFADDEQDRLTINAGSKHGVQVQDVFTIYKVDLNLEDPITGANLGDNFNRLGMVQVMRVGEGFSEAVILAGHKFKRGFLARGENPQTIDDELSVSADDEENLDGIFKGIHRNRAHPPTKAVDLDFFSVFGFELDF